MFHEIPTLFSLTADVEGDSTVVFEAHPFVRCPRSTKSPVTSSVGILYPVDAVTHFHCPVEVSPANRVMDSPSCGVLATADRDLIQTVTLHQTQESTLAIGDDTSTREPRSEEDDLTQVPRNALSLQEKSESECKSILGTYRI